MGLHACLLYLLLLRGTEGRIAAGARSAEEGIQGEDSHSTSPVGCHDARGSHDPCTSCGPCRKEEIKGRGSFLRLRFLMKSGVVVRGASARYDCYLPSIRDYDDSADLQEEVLRRCRDEGDGFSDAVGWQRHLVYVTVRSLDVSGGVHLTLYFGLTRADNSKEMLHATPASESLTTSRILLQFATFLLVVVISGVAEVWRRRRRLGEGQTRQLGGSSKSSMSECQMRKSQKGRNDSQPKQSWKTESLSDDPSENGAKSDLTGAASTSDGKTTESSPPCEEEQVCGQSQTTEPSAEDGKSSIPLESDSQPSTESSTTPSPSPLQPERRPQLSTPVVLSDVINYDPGAYMRSLHCDEIARIFSRAVTPTLQSHVTKGDLTEEASAALLERHVRETRDLADQWMERWQRGSPETLMLSDVWVALLSIRKAAIFKEVQGLSRAASLRG